MKTGIIVLCRYNSSRLPGKILREINGKPVLQYILDRLKLVSNAYQVVVATSTEKSDQPIVDYCLSNDVLLYRGSLDNVAQRFADCAQYYNWDYAIRINGDNMLVDGDTIVEMIKIATEHRYDFVSNVKGRTFPIGMSVEIVNVGFYQKAIVEFRDPRYFEHVTLYFYEHEDAVPNSFFFYNRSIPEAKGLKLALDTPADFRRIEGIVKQMDKDHIQYRLKDICKLANT